MREVWQVSVFVDVSALPSATMMRDRRGAADVDVRIETVAGAMPTFVAYRVPQHFLDPAARLWQITPHPERLRSWATGATSAAELAACAKRGAEIAGRSCADRVSARSSAGRSGSLDRGVRFYPCATQTCGANAAGVTPVATIAACGDISDVAGCRVGYSLILTTRQSGYRAGAVTPAMVRW